jgi:hypothetical protein
VTEYLSGILFPFETGSFLKHYEAREHFHITRTSPGYYAGVLSDDGLDELLQSERLPAAFVNVVKDGTKYHLEEWSRVIVSARDKDRVVIPERLFDLYAQGATIILNDADRTVPSLNAACRILCVETGFPVQANVYITPRGAAGFSKHSDDHEVLILQIGGSKRWLLYPPDSQAAGGSTGPIEIDLQSGDLLFLPRGLAHSAHTQEADSIHVTLGFRPAYAFQLIRELAELAGEDADFQQPLPPRFADTGVKLAFEAAFLGRLQSLISRTSPSELMERRFHSLVEKQATGWPGRLSDLRHVHEMTPETVVCRRPGILTLVNNDGTFLNIDFAGKRVRIPAFLEEVQERIMSENAFTVREIGGFISNSGKVKLIAEFVTAGLLRIVTI